MGILEKIKKKPEDQMADADHPDRKDISDQQFQEALTEIAEKYKDAEPANEMTAEEKRKRGEAILKTLNETKNPY